MSGLELPKIADFYADLNGRFALTNSLALWRDISERLHQPATEPEDVTYREATANGALALWVIPAHQRPQAGRDHWADRRRFAVPARPRPAQPRPARRAVWATAAPGPR